MELASTPDLSRFERVLFFTGAGLSVESGIPTYRGAGGIWQQYNYEDYACERAFRRDPVKVWEFHEKRRALVAGCAPNRAHHLIAAFQRLHPGTRIVTQNIDGLHQRAGARDVVELHGSLWRLRCAAGCGTREDRSVPLDSHRCSCGAWLRPDLVWFEDALELAVLQAAVDAARACDCIVSIGTSGYVYPAAELPFLAMEAGAVSIEINPEETPVSPHFDHRLRGSAAAMLPRLWPGEEED